MQISIGKKGDAKTLLDHDELRKRTRLEKEIHKKQGRNNESLINAINLIRDQDKDIDFVINDYWKKFWLDLE